MGEGVGDLVFNQTWVMEPGTGGAIVTPLISTSDLREELDVNTYFYNTSTILISTSDQRKELDVNTNFYNTYTILIKYLFLHQITGRSLISRTNCASIGLRRLRKRLAGLARPNNTL